MKDLTIDVQILIYGSDLASDTERQNCQPCRTLLDRMKQSESARLVIDCQGTIKAQYDSKLRFGAFGKEWVRTMAQSGKVVYVSRVNLDRGTQRRLMELHFDHTDLPYVRTAAASESKRLMTRDDDYPAPIQRLLRDRCEIRVIGDPTAASRWLEEP